MLAEWEAIEDAEEGATKAHLPIEVLAELGRVQEAIRYVNRFLGQLPEDEDCVCEIVRMAQLRLEPEDLAA